MRTIINKYMSTCPKTGKIIGIKFLSDISKMLAPFIGIAAVAWILFRVITKPSRITYPCVRVAMPVASSFIAYFVIPALAIFAWFRARKNQVAATALFAVAGLGGTFVLDSDILTTKEVQLATIIQPANQSMGTAVGIFPGRVVWAHNPDATNENCVPDANGAAWFMPENNDQAVVDNMVSSVLRSLTGQTSDNAAWRAIFEYHNSTMRGKEAENYSAGEKIFIKINATSTWGAGGQWDNYNSTDLSVRYNDYYGISETSPAMVLAVLRQLVNVVGVAQSDIYVGDPMKHIYKHCYELWHGEFPNVYYLDVSGYTNLGREKVVKSTTAKIHYSDKGDVLRTGSDSQANYGDPIYDDYFYTIFENMEYMINIPMLKAHKRAGITAFAKNHLGSHTRADAKHLHMGLVAPDEMEKGVTRSGYGLYRVQVDLMTHSLLGKKNLVYLMDALWATDKELGKPLKWKMPPFNDDYTSSVFASLDPVAIESVGYDFLRSEFTAERGAGIYVQMDGVDDYLHQAADSLNWPVGTRYDPDSTGVYVKSLGVHEHWNDAGNMQYSRNLGPGDGIELIKAGQSLAVKDQEHLPQSFVLYQNYPNPFNPTTIINFYLPVKTFVSVKIYNIMGQEIETLVHGEVAAGLHEIHWTAKNLSSGVYFYKMQTNNFLDTKKLVYQK